jgi:proteic killer suppression protein
MIIGFRHKGLEEFYRTESLRGIQPAHASKLARILAALDAAATAEVTAHPPAPSSEPPRAAASTPIRQSVTPYAANPRSHRVEQLPAEELNLPAFRLHPLKGQLRGYWSIWVNGVSARPETYCGMAVDSES